MHYPVSWEGLRWLLLELHLRKKVFLLCEIVQRLISLQIFGGKLLLAFPTFISFHYQKHFNFTWWPMTPKPSALDVLIKEKPATSSGHRMTTGYSSPWLAKGWAPHLNRPNQRDHSREVIGKYSLVLINQCLLRKVEPSPTMDPRIYYDLTLLLWELVTVLAGFFLLSWCWAWSHRSGQKEKMDVAWGTAGISGICLSVTGTYAAFSLAPNLQSRCRV